MADKIALPTLWHIPDDLWEKIQLLLPQKASGSLGYPHLCSRRVLTRRVLNGILHVMRTGCQWKAVPAEFGSGSSLHRYFQRWSQEHIFEMIWVLMLECYDERVGIAWDWQAVDGTMLKAPLGGSSCGPNPTDRGKLGSKRHTLVDRRGAPLTMELAAANSPDMRLLKRTINSIVVEQPSFDEVPQNLCLDKGYDFPSCHEFLATTGYQLHLRRKREPVVPEVQRKYPARRWIVECVHAWHNKYRKIKTRYEKNDQNYLGLVDFASALIVYHIIYRFSPTATLDCVLG